MNTADLEQLHPDVEDLVLELKLYLHGELQFYRRDNIRPPPAAPAAAAIVPVVVQRAA